MADVAAAFDAVAADYDRTWGTNPVGLMFRRVVQERLAASFAAGARVIDLGCGTGEDAVFLAARAVHVTGVDASPQMLARACARAEGLGLHGSIRLLHGSIEALAGLRPGWDGAFSNLGALNCADVGAVGRRLAELLRPGAPVVLAVMGPHPLPALVRRAIRGRGARRTDGDVIVGGVPVAVRYFRREPLTDAFGPGFVWKRAFALGVCTPAPADRRWVEDHPLGFAGLAMVERLLRSVPGLRNLGDHLVLEGARA